MTNDDGGVQKPSLAALPTRLRDWQMSPSRETFAYGGDEVDLSVWDIENAFTPKKNHETQNISNPKSKKGLFPGEIWRAKNVMRTPHYDDKSPTPALGCE